MKVNMSNEALMAVLEAEFKPKGIVAYSGCCRWGCTGSYDETDPEFQVRDQGGVFYIRLHLAGMNYRPTVEACYAMYEDIAYLREHWEQERALLAKFCHLLGYEDGGFEIVKPESERRAIEIKFLQPLELAAE
eukprot:m.357277 g.357277  ORF g.357277 m.357277 type:complete len:133 (+) comp17768_c0_seq1:172-570(+)